MTTQHTEAALIARMAQATTLTEQRAAAEELTAFRNARREEAEREASLDWDAMREVDLRPQFVSEPVTAAAIGSEASALDWLDEVVPDSHDLNKVAVSMRTNATLWYESLWEAVKHDPTEFAIQARNAARRNAAEYGLQAPQAESVFVDHVAHLHRTAGFTTAMDETQPGPYHMPNGSDLDNPTNTDTFDGIVNGENPESSEDPKTEPSDSPSLKEGDQPESDQDADGVTPPVNDDDGAKFTKDDAQGTSYTDPMPSGGKSSSLFAKIRQVFAYTPPEVDGGTDKADYGPADTSDSGRPKTDASDSPSLAEGTQPEGDRSEPFIQPQQPAQDKSTWGGDPDALSTGGQDGTNAANGPTVQGTPTTSSLRSLGTAIARQATTDNTRVFGQALATMSSLDERRAEFTGHDIVKMVLSSGDVSAQHRDALQRLVEEDEFHQCEDNDGDGICDECGTPMGLAERWASEQGNTCAVCGDKIAQDPGGENPSTWHHDNGEKHDHEAKPAKEAHRTAAEEGECGYCAGTGRVSNGAPGMDLGPGFPAFLECPRCDGTGKGNPNLKPYTMSSRTAAEYQGGSPKAGDTAVCHKDGKPIEFFDGAWYHLKGGPSHNDVYPASKSESSRRTAGDSVEVANIPSCDICAYEEGNHGVPAAYDGKTVMGPWANMCERHFQSHGIGLGTGRGQRLVQRQSSLGDPEDLFAVTAADYSTDKTPGRWVVEVLGNGESKWARNSLTFDSRSEAEAYAKDLAGRWFGMDVARVREIPSGGLPPSLTETFDPDDPGIVVNYRTASRGGGNPLAVEAGEGQRIPLKCPNCGNTWWKKSLYGGEHCPKCNTKGETNYKKSARGNDFSLSDAKNEEGEWIMSPEQIRAEMAYDPYEDDPDGYYTGSRRTAAPFAILTPDKKPLWGKTWETEEEARAHFDKVKDRTDALVPKDISTYQVGKVSTRQAAADTICPYCDFTGSHAEVGRHIEEAGPEHQAGGTVTDQLNERINRSGARGTEEIQGQTFDTGECATCGAKIIGQNGNWVHDPRSPMPSHPDGSVAGDAHAPKPA